MNRDLLLKLGCLFCAVLLLGATAGCGKKGDPRPPALVSTMEEGTLWHPSEGGNPGASAGAVFSPPDTRRGNARELETR